MSDRLNLWPKEDTKGNWATVNLYEHESMAKAIRAFSNRGQVLKVFGPENAVKECHRLWTLLEEEDALSPVSLVSWYVQPPELQPDGTRKCIEWVPE
jgi:hypothetical protein